MEITKVSAKELVKELKDYENSLEKEFKGNKQSNEYFLYLKKNFMNLTLENTSRHTYKLCRMDATRNSVFAKNSNGHTHLFIYYLFEISNSIQVDGLIVTYELAFNLFNEIFKSN